MANRRDLFDPTDPNRMTPEQRLDEVAAILAAGVRRMRERRRAAACVPKISPESGETCLELSRRSSPDGPCG